MTITPSLEEQVAALREGHAELPAEGWTVVELTGSEAGRWLNDLVTADVEALGPEGTVRSLLLGPTGKIRADLLVHRRSRGLVLLQGPGQPRSIDGLLQPYVLSSDVALGRSSSSFSLRPYPDGTWLVSEGEPRLPVGREAFESWRIRSGIARFPIDLDEDSLPAEAGLDEAPVVARDKGCYLGQEAVAKVRNLGHPTRLVLAVVGAGRLDHAGEVIADGQPVGRLTSVDVRGDGRSALARIRWEAKDSELRAAGQVLARR
jgi:hypothetical protein